MLQPLCVTVAMGDNTCPLTFFFFFFNDTATTEIYTLSLHDALPIYQTAFESVAAKEKARRKVLAAAKRHGIRSEEHTSELQSLTNLVCRLLLEKKKTIAMDDCTPPIVAAVHYEGGQGRNNRSGLS